MKGVFRRVVFNKEILFGVGLFVTRFIFGLAYQFIMNKRTPEQNFQMDDERPQTEIAIEPDLRKKMCVMYIDFISS